MVRFRKKRKKGGWGLFSVTYVGLKPRTEGFCDLSFYFNLIYFFDFFFGSRMMLERRRRGAWREKEGGGVEMD